MKSSLKKRLLCLTLIACLCLSVITIYPNVINKGDKDLTLDSIIEHSTWNDSKNVASNLPIEKVKFSYSSGSERDYTSDCYYSDKYFYKKSCDNNEIDGFNINLATSSLCLALSTFNSNDGGTSDYSNKFKNAKQLLEDLHFSNFEHNDWFEKKPECDSIGVVAAKKELKDVNSTNNNYTLIAVAIRGGGYESEWAGNFTIGKSGEHLGFSKAKNQVISFLKQYIKDNEISGNVKIWITGYSRAAATANLTAGAINNGENLGNIVLNKEDLYAYCFETPKGATKDEIGDRAKHRNIYNIVNKNDPVTMLGMKTLGFERYGTDFILPDKSTDDMYLNKKEEMLKFYTKMENYAELDKYVIDDFSMYDIEMANLFFTGESPFQINSNSRISQAIFIDNMLEDIAKKTVKSRKNYVNEYQDGVRTIIKDIYGASFTETIKCKSKEFSDIFIKNMSSSLVLDDITSTILNPMDSKNVKDIIIDITKKSVNELGIGNISAKELDSFAVTIEKSIINLVIDNPNLVVTFYKNFSLLVQAHYPEICLSWMMSMDSNYNEKSKVSSGNGNYRVIKIDSPVDVKVYNNEGVLKADITDNISQDIDNGIITSVNDKDEKLLYLPFTNSYKIVLSTTSKKKIDLSINEYSTSLVGYTRIQNYNNIKMKKGEKYTISTPQHLDLSNYTYGTSVDYLLKKDNGSVVEPSSNYLENEISNIKQDIDIY